MTLLHSSRWRIIFCKLSTLTCSSRNDDKVVLNRDMIVQLDKVRVSITLTLSHIFFILLELRCDFVVCLCTCVCVCVSLSLTLLIQKNGLIPAFQCNFQKNDGQLQWIDFGRGQWRPVGRWRNETPVGVIDRSNFLSVTWTCVGSSTRLITFFQGLG